MNEVDNLFEQNQSCRRLTQASTQYDTIKISRPQCRLDRLLGGLAEIDETSCGIVPQCTQALDVSVEVGANVLGSKPGGGS